MAELTKTDNRQPMGKIKPTDKMVMMQSLFDGMKPATSKQHYGRFNLYINFQTKSGHLTDPVREAIDLFKHTLDKTALVWFLMNRSKLKNLTTLKRTFLQRYNPWGKTKREQLQSWNILSFNPKNTDVDEHIDLINTLGDMVDQKGRGQKGKVHRDTAYDDTDTFNYVQRLGCSKRHSKISRTHNTKIRSTYSGNANDGNRCNSTRIIFPYSTFGGQRRG